MDTRAMQVRVVTDSGADLAADVAAQLGIMVVPLIVRFGQQVYLDGQLSADEFWHKTAEGPSYPGTSQPSIGAFEEAFAGLVDAGQAVLCLTITSRHSGTFSTASAAARRFGDRVRVIDTRSLSLGQGFQVLAAARAAAGGASLDEIVPLVEQVQARTHLFILLSTIEYIRRGGRADLLIPLLDRVTRALSIKPILNLADGRLSVYGLARSYERGLTRVRQDVLRLQPIESLAVIHVRHPTVAADMAHTLSEQVGFPLQDIVMAETGPALSVHGGPNVIGVILVQRPDRTVSRG